MVKRRTVITVTIDDTEVELVPVSLKSDDRSVKRLAIAAEGDKVEGYLLKLPEEDKK